MSLSSIQPYAKLPFAGVLLPEITISPSLRESAGATESSSNAEFLKQLCRRGFELKLKHLDETKKKEYEERVTFELDTIESLGFSNYLLMVWDICRFSDEKGIPRGPGRGSVGSSLVSYLIGITELDPIVNGLFFSRFLSKARAKKVVVDGVTYIDGGLVPDIDCDFSYYRRGEIIEYLNARYPGQTSKLLTTTTFTSKILIKDVLKVFEGAPEEDAKVASDLIEKKHGNPVELEDGFYGDGKWRDGDTENGTAPNDKLVEWAETHAETMEIAMGLSGLNRAQGQHASAVLICHESIGDLIPLQLTAETANEKEMASGFDMYSAQEIIIKMDILGLRTLDVIEEVCKLIGIKRQDIDVNHPSIYLALQDFRLRYGIFQLETFAQGNAAVKVKPKSFTQLSDILAIARPGAFASLDKYCDYVHNGNYTSVHPLIDDILRPTGGVALYQETLLAMLIRVGMTPERAENARRVLAKKKTEEVPAIKEEIRGLCKANGHPTEITDLLVQIAEDSGGYSFNKCLSLDTIIHTQHGLCRAIDIRVGDFVMAYNVALQCDHLVRVNAIHKSQARLFEVSFEDSHTEGPLCCSMQHKLLCHDNVMRPLVEVLSDGWLVITNRKPRAQMIKSIRPLTIQPTLDLEVDHLDHNFYANGIVVSNSHSSTYAMITAYTLYLKANHPIEFYWALLRMSRHEANGHEVIAQIEKEMRSQGFKLLPPQFSTSMDFSIESKNSIRFALSMVRGVSDKNQSRLESFIGAGGVSSDANKFQAFQAIKNAGLHIGVACSLIQAGCLSAYGASRSRLVLECSTFNLLSDKEKGLCLTIGAKPEINWDVLDAILYLRDNLDENGKPLMKATRFATIKKKYENYKEIYQLNHRNERLANYWYEKTVLGYSYSQTLRGIFGKELDGLVSIKEAREAQEGEFVRVIGFAKDPEKHKTKAGNDGFKMWLVDETEEIMVRFFNAKIERCVQDNERLPEELDLVVVTAKKMDGDVVFADRVGIQTTRIFMRLSELRDEAAKKAAKAEKDKDAEAVETVEVSTTEVAVA